jgi:hypothetical protein
MGKTDQDVSIPTGSCAGSPSGITINLDYYRGSHIHPQKLRWLTYHGAKRHEVGSDMGLKDVVLTTYETLQSDRTKQGPLFQQEWERIILDEGTIYSKFLIFYKSFL